MDAFDALALAVTISVTGTLAVTFAVGWFRAHRRMRALERQVSEAAPDTTVIRLEANLVTLSEQVEQLASGQDFLSRLLADRLPAQRIQPATPEVQTPP